MKKYFNTKLLSYIALFIYNAFLLLFTDCYLILPLKYLPVYKYNDSNPIDIMQSIVSTKVYVDIDMGTPQQSVEIPLDFDSNDFYISDNPEKDFAEYPKLFSDIKFYNLSKSNSKITLEDIYYDGDNFELGEYCQESFYLDKKKYELGIYIPIKLKYPESGGIGLLLKSSSAATHTTEKTFLKKLKDKNLINDYYWSIFYNSKTTTEEEKGFILLGSLPDELGLDLGYYNKDYFNKNNLQDVRAELSSGIVTTIFKMDEISFYEGNNINKIIDNFPTNYSYILDVKLNYHSSGIEAPNILLKNYEKIFEEFISKKECFKDQFYNGEKKTFFYCKNNKDTIEKIKNVFPLFNFLSKDLQYSYTLDVNDLFFEKNDYVYCLVYFPNSEFLGKKWVMGKPFLKKYQFYFNPEDTHIYFYSNKNEERKEENNENGNISIGMIILIIVITIIVMSIIFILIFKFYLYDKYFRKKRANELDDDYDYTQKNEDDIPNNLGINNNE